MLTSEIIDLINSIEAEFPVSSWRINGVKVWPLIRIRLNFDLYYFHYTKSTPKKGTVGKVVAKLTRQGRSVVKYLEAVVRDAAKNDSVTSSCDVLLLSDGVSFTKINGDWLERFCDPIIDELHRKGYKSLLLTPTENYCIPRRTPSRFIQPHLDAVFMLSEFKFRLSGAPVLHLPGYQDVIDYLAASGCEVLLPTIDALSRQVCLIMGYAHYFRSLLVKLRPSVTFVVSYYGNEGMAFNLACRQQKVSCIDIQHGVQGELHVAYGRWKSVPEDGYELLPSHFWCWQPEDLAAITAWSPQKYHQPLLGGNLWLDLWLKGTAEFVQTCDKTIGSFKQHQQASLNILVTLQSNLDDRDTLKPLLLAIGEADSSMFWWIRLHPCMLGRRRYIRDLLNSTGNQRFDLDMATDQPLYAILRHVDAHVTHSSSTVIEAREFGVPSVIFSRYGMEFFTESIESGWALVAGDQNVLPSILQQMDKRTWLREQHPLFRQEQQGLAHVMAMLEESKKIQKEMMSRS